METGATGVTLSDAALLVMELSVAVIANVPVATPFANPCVPEVLLMVAISVLDEAQVALVVRS